MGVIVSVLSERGRERAGGDDARTYGIIVRRQHLLNLLEMRKLANLEHVEPDALLVPLGRHLAVPALERRRRESRNQHGDVLGRGALVLETEADAVRLREQLLDLGDAGVLELVERSAVLERLGLLGGRHGLDVRVLEELGAHERGVLARPAGAREEDADQRGLGAHHVAAVVALGLGEVRLESLVAPRRVGREVLQQRVDAIHSTEGVAVVLEVALVNAKNHVGRKGREQLMVLQQQ